MSQYLENLNWRYATKRMLPSKSLEPKTIENILEAIRLAPTSMGVQPFSVYVIQNQETKQKIQPACYNQPQIIECDTLLAFFAWKNMSQQEIDKYIQNVAKTRQQDLASLAGLRNMIETSLPKNLNEFLTWSKHQAYLALGMAVMTCSLEKIDSTPMEGFLPNEVNEVLEVDTNRLHAAVLLAIGHRDNENDKLSKAKKVRRASSDLFVRI